MNSKGKLAVQIHFLRGYDESFIWGSPPQSELSISDSSHKAENSRGGSLF